MPVVLDNSVACSLILDEEASPYALEVKDAIERGEQAFAPPLLFSEFANVLCTSCRRRRMDRIDIPEAIRSLYDLGITEIRFTTDELLGLADLALDWEVTAYDAHYVALARQRQLPLATLDRGMRNAAGRAGVRIFGD